MQNVMAILPVVFADSALLVALSGTNRLLIVAVLVGLFTASVVAYHLRSILFERARRQMNERDWMAPPPESVDVMPEQRAVGFATHDDLSTLLAFNDNDEPTNYEELSNASVVRTVDQPIIRSWSREIIGDELDVLDLQIGKFVPAFRDEYFLAEARDAWMKRFHRRHDAVEGEKGALFPRTLRRWTASSTWELP